MLTEYRIQPTSQTTFYPEEMLAHQDKESSPWATAKINHCYFLCKLYSYVGAKCALIHEFCILTLYFYCCPLCVSHRRWETVEYGHRHINICLIISCVQCFFSLGLNRQRKWFQSNSVDSAVRLYLTNVTKEKLRIYHI